MRNAIFAAAILLLFGCAQPAPVPDLKAQIDANNAAWSAAANRGDAAGVAAIGGSGVRNFALAALDVGQVGPDTAREIGQFSAEAPGPKKQMVRLEGKYVVVWKLVGGKWLLDVDIWNANK